jgi:alcohol dehydrogenase
MKVKAAVLRAVGVERPWADSSPISVLDVELDEPGPNELLVRMEAAGVCHSDLSRVSGVRQCHVPMALGHEGCGIVERIGEDVDGVRVGDKVTMTFMPRCGECAACCSTVWSLCERGLAANAAGEMLAGGRRISLHGEQIDHHGGVSAFAEYAIVDVHSVVVIPSQIPSAIGALLGAPG